jgi:hypothetical protein
VTDILKLLLAPWIDGKLSAHVLCTQRTTDTLGSALARRVGFGVTTDAGIHYRALRRIDARSPSLARLKSAFI